MARRTEYRARLLVEKAAAIMNLTCVFFGLVFLAAGILFASGKLHPHLSAWKAMTQEEKEAIRIVPLCQNIGTMISLSGIIFLTYGVFPAFPGSWFSGIMIAWLVAAGIDLWFIARSKKYTTLNPMDTELSIAEVAGTAHPSGKLYKSPILFRVLACIAVTSFVCFTCMVAIRMLGTNLLG